MSDNFATGIVSVMLAVVGVATIAVIFSTKGQTANVITAGGNALAENITAAVSPVTGSMYTPGSLSSSF